MVHMDFSLVFFFALFTLSLSLSSCSFVPPFSLSCLTLSPSPSLSPSLFFTILALAGHAAAAELFGSLGFMVATLPLSNDGLVNSDLHWCGETFPYAQFALCVRHLPRCFVTVTKDSM